MTPEMNFVKGFDQGQFCQYMENTFSIDPFGRALMLNIIDYAQKHEHVSKDQFAYFVSDMIPEIEFRDVAAFCEDAILTGSGIQEKKAFWEQREISESEPEI